MRIKEDQCSYTNHQNDVTYYNMVNQHKIQNFQLHNKVALPLLFTTIMLLRICDIHENLQREGHILYLHNLKQSRTCTVKLSDILNVKITLIKSFVQSWVTLIAV